MKKGGSFAPAFFVWKSGSVLFPEYPEDMEKKVDDIQVEIYGHINGVIDRFCDVIGPIHIIADVQREYAGSDVVDDCKIQSRDEYLGNSHEQETKKG